MDSRLCVNFLDLASGDLLDIPHTPRVLPRVMTVPGIISDVDGYGSTDGDSDVSRERRIIVANMLPLHAKRDTETDKWCFSLDEDSPYLQLKDGFSPEKQSRLGDSLLVQFTCGLGGSMLSSGLKEEVGDIEGDAPQVKRLRRSSSDALQDMISGEELSLYGSAPNNADSAQKTFSFAVRDSLINVGPLKDFSYGLRMNADANATGLAKQSNYELVCCSGHGKNGALCVLRQSIRPEMITEFNLYVWDEDLRQWNLVWTAIPQKIFGFCGVFGIYNQQNVPLCDCPNGFIPKYPADWDKDDYSGGCNRRNPIQCFHGGKDIFLTIPNMRLPEALPYPEVKNVEECKLNCLSHCDCNAYEVKTRYQERMLGLWELSSPALISSIVSSIIWRVYYAVGALEEVEFSLILFKYQDIRRATKNFSQKLGEGGFGSVFKGTLPNSIAIAVKKIRSLQQGEKQFRAEVSTLGAIQHVNLLRLHGFCVEASKRFLVYEYMPKAKGLAYLHESCRDCIIHFDIKPENKLLDAEDVPKVADFGLAKVIGRDFSQVLTTMRGTRGYLAPEWISGEAVTPKVDVFNYGKLLFEIVSGRRNINMLDDEICNYFPARVAIAMNKGEDLLTLLDYKLEGNANVEDNV
uniref:Protein kinase domain-containing protein n=1 Tax=Fagus sylvatica TaxID=28930 RepID=A0A2N9IMS6_FAGSY